MECVGTTGRATTGTGNTAAACSGITGTGGGGLITDACCDACLAKLAHLAFPNFFPPSVALGLDIGSPVEDTTGGGKGLRGGGGGTCGGVCPTSSSRKAGFVMMFIGAWTVSWDAVVAGGAEGWGGVVLPPVKPSKRSFGISPLSIL